VDLLFARLLCSVARPFLVLTRLKNPCLLFLTKWLGLNVFRGPQRTWVELKAGCAEIFGRRSSGAADEAPVDVAEGIISRRGLDNVGKIVGRRGARDVRVLKLH
jgi:hypothetical protein